MRLIGSYVRAHPRPFLISVGGAFLYPAGSTGLTILLGRRADQELKPPFAGGVIFLVVFAMVALIATDPFLALIGLLLFPTLALMNHSFAKRMEGPARRAQEKIGDVSAVAHESIDGALIVKTLGREDEE